MVSFPWKLLLTVLIFQEIKNLYIFEIRYITDLYFMKTSAAIFRNSVYYVSASYASYYYRWFRFIQKLYLANSKNNIFDKVSFFISIDFQEFCKSIVLSILYFRDYLTDISWKTVQKIFRNSVPSLRISPQLYNNLDDLLITLIRYTK